MENKRLFIDMDGTLARFHDEINYLERMFEKDFFRNLLPFENMVAGIRKFMDNHPEVEVYILSAKVEGEPPYCEEEKHTWLNQFLPEIPKDHRIFTKMGRPKAEYIPGGLRANDYLLDDYNKGLNQFLFDGGKAIKCHNNINQRGLGAYGGKAGNLWTGPMVHIDDTPEMIAAELAAHMCLSYDLDKVYSSYLNVTDITAGTAMKEISKELATYDLRASNPLNAIRFLNGQDEFREYHLRTSSGQPLTVPAHMLRDVCHNIYFDPDFMPYLEQDPIQLADDVVQALINAKTAIVGRIHYLQTDGNVGYTASFRTKEEMVSEIEACTKNGVPIDPIWDVTLPVKHFSELSYFEKEDKFYYDYNLDIDTATRLAIALDRPAEKRTRDEMVSLLIFYLQAKPPVSESLNSFLGLDHESIHKFLLSEKASFSFNPNKQGIDHLIQSAKEQQYDSLGTDPQHPFKSR